MTRDLDTICPTLLSPEKWVSATDTLPSTHEHFVAAVEGFKQSEPVKRQAKLLTCDMARASNEVEIHFN